MEVDPKLGIRMGSILKPLIKGKGIQVNPQNWPENCFPENAESPFQVHQDTVEPPGWAVQAGIGSFGAFQAWKYGLSRYIYPLIY